jgi:heptosyltransferase-1
MSARSFLIIKTSAIGDIIQTLPVLSYLRQRFPTATIDWVVEKAGRSLLESHPSLDRLYCIDSKKWRKAPFAKETRKEFKAFYQALSSVTYDAIFDLQGNAKSGLITKLAKGRDKVGFARDSVPEFLNLLSTNIRFSTCKERSVRARYLSLIRHYFQDQTFVHSPLYPTALRISQEEQERLHALSLPKRPCFMVAFGSKWRNKQLSFDTLLSWLKNVEQKLNCSFLFIFGDLTEKEVAGQLQNQFLGSSQVVGDLSLPLWQALMYKVDAVLAVDSAALHLCATTTTPSFSVFGPSIAAFYKPAGEKHFAFQAKCPYGKSFDRRCPALRTCATGACLKNLSAQELTAAFLSWWRLLP